MLQSGFAWLAAAAFAASLGYFLYAYVVVFGPVSPDTETSWSGIWSAPALTNLALFTAFALHHSLFARTGVKRIVRSLVPATLERAVYTMVASILFTLVCWLWQPVDGLAWMLPGPWRWVGFATQATGVVMTVIGGRALNLRELAGVRQVQPGGSDSVSLKTDGLYGFVRHPLYFAWVLLVFGAPEMTMTRLTFAGISTLYLAVAIPFEERSLIETFGADYASYRKSVRWRMLPGVY